MNKQELFEYCCESLKGDLNKFINGIDVNKIVKKIEQLDEPQKVTVPQFVADWIKYCKNTNVTMTRALLVGEVDFYNYANQKDHFRLVDFLGSRINQEIFARAWFDGYEVEKEKRYIVKVKGVEKGYDYLNHRISLDSWFFSGESEPLDFRTKHTRKELEEAGFGEVFNSPLFEVEEVTE